MFHVKLPPEIQDILKTLETKGFSAYVVGGCVRDIIRGVAPKDWDITTSAKPEEIQALFPDSFYENTFGTVTIKVSGVSRETEEHTKGIGNVEITTFRTETSYSDKRHPDAINFAKTVEEDLSRRDFTMNAIAMSLDGKLVDPYEGQKDIEERVIKAVGDPKERFNEDALRMMRAVRFATVLDFKIEKETADAIKKDARLIQMVAEERIRDEFIKIVDAREARKGIELLEELGLLRYVFPELHAGVGVGQNKHHIYTVFEHNVRALEWSAKNHYAFHVKLASLLHDVGKPQTKRGEGIDSTFYGHEIVGARIARKALQRLRFRQDVIDKVWLLVRYHLFYYNVGEVSEHSIRRLIAKVGAENISELLEIRMADRKGSGVPKAMPYRLRHFQYMVEKVQKDPTSVKMLAVNGTEVMQILGIEPGPKVGQVLAILLDEVLDDPSKNTKEYLSKEVQAFGELEDDELQRRRKQSEEKQKQFDETVDQNIKGKYYV